MSNTDVLGTDDENSEELDDLLQEIDIDDDDRIIKLFGRVNHGLSFAVWMGLEHLSARSDEEITLVINSQGGTVYDMFSIVDAMALCPCDIRTVGTGVIASAATLILAAGTPGRRYLTPNCMVMTHELQWGYPAGLGEVLTIAEVAKKMEARYHSLMAKYCSKSVSEIEPYLTGHGNWMFAKEAIKKIGIADKLMTKSKW